MLMFIFKPSDKTKTYSHALWSLSLHYYTQSIASRLYTFCFLLDVLSFEWLWTSPKLCFLVPKFVGAYKRLWNRMVLISSFKTITSVFLWSRFRCVLCSSGLFSWFAWMSSVIEGCKGKCWQLDMEISAANWTRK